MEEILDSLLKNSVKEIHKALKCQPELCLDNVCPTVKAILIGGPEELYDNLLLHSNSIEEIIDNKNKVLEFLQKK